MNKILVFIAALVFSGCSKDDVDSSHLYNYNQDVVLVFDGNSLTKGTAGGDGGEQYYPNVVKDYFTGKFNSVEFYSYGSDGKTLFKMVSQMSIDIIPRAVVGKTNFIIAWEDVNGLLTEGAQHFNAQKQWDAFVTYFENCANAGFQHKILITGYNTRCRDSSETELNNQLQRDIFINRVKETPLTDVPWDYHIDLNEAPHIGGPKGLPQDPIYFADTVHLKSEGYDIIAEIIIKKIKDIIRI